MGLFLSPVTGLAGEPDGAPAAPARRELPTDGRVAFSYSRADDVADCTQPDEVAMRLAVRGVMRVDPFVPAGAPAPVKLAVRVARTPRGAVRATFELLDAGGASMGVSHVTDATCDGAHLKLIASIALLIQPAPAAEESRRDAADVGGGAKAGEGGREGGAGAMGSENAGAAATKPEVPSRPSASAGGESRTSAAVPGVEAPRAGAPVDRSAVCKTPLLGYCAPVDIHSVSLALGGVMSLNFSADPGPGMWIHAELRPVEVFSMGVEVRGLFPSRIVLSAPADPSKPYATPKEPDLSNLSVMLVPCLRYWWLMGCGVAHLGFAMAQTPAEITALPVMGVGPRIGLEVPLGERFFARAQGDVLFNFSNNEFGLEDQNLVWQQSFVSGFIGLGAGVAFK